MFFANIKRLDLFNKRAVFQQMTTVFTIVPLLTLVLSKPILDSCFPLSLQASNQMNHAQFYFS